MFCWQDSGALSFIAVGNVDDIAFAVGNLATSHKIIYAFPFHIAIPVLGIYPEHTPLTVRKYMCIRLSTGTLFVNTKYWQ